MQIQPGIHACKQHRLQEVREDEQTRQRQGQELALLSRDELAAVVTKLANAAGPSLFGTTQLSQVKINEVKGKDSEGRSRAGEEGDIPGGRAGRAETSPGRLLGVTRCWLR